MTKRISPNIRILQARVAALRAELVSAYTVGLGPAAVQSVQESLDCWVAELARVSL